MDATDRRILEALQSNACAAVSAIAESAGVPEAECQSRISALESSGVIQGRVALLDPRKVGAGVTIFVAITAPEHTADWLDKFHATVKEFPEVQEFYRMSGQVDYLLRVVVADIDGYDAFYKKLIGSTDLKDVSSTFAMEQIKYTTKLPIAAEA